MSEAAVAVPVPPARRVPGIGDMAAVAVATGAASGAIWAAPVPLAVAGLALVPAVVPALRRPALLVVLAVLVTSALAARSLDGLSQPRPSNVEGWATLVTEPERFGSSVRTDVRLAGRRYEVWWRSGHAGLVDERTVGDRLWVVGRVQPADPSDLSWYRPRHVAGRLTVEEIVRMAPATPPWSWANRIRADLEAGMGSFGERDRALALGFLVGDDRHQPPEVTDDFRASGLTHLTAVSGQNVAFVLAVVSPLLRRRRLVGRFLWTIAVLALFGFVTRWEPSVMRAAAMATVTAVGSLVGRPARPVRRLALAVTALLLIDPLLVWSAGFRLSVAATLGIAVLAVPLAQRLGGPRLVREPLSVTLAAQVGVAPLLLAFGPVPLASVPANLLAGPAAGMAMMWGLPAGLVAGWVAEPLAALIHAPTRIMVVWVAGVARVAAAAPIPALGWFEVMVACGATLAAAVLRRRSWRRGVVLIAFAAVALSLGAHERGTGHVVAWGLEAWTGDGAVVVAVDRPGPSSALAQLRRWEIDGIDVLVARSSSGAAGEAVAAIVSRHAVAQVVRSGDLAAGRRMTLLAGDLRLDISPAGPGRLVMEVTGPG